MIKSITGHFKYYFMQIILEVAGSRVPRNGAEDRDERGCEPRYLLPGKWRAAPVRDCLRHRPKQFGVAGMEARRQVLLHRSEAVRTTQNNTLP